MGRKDIVDENVKNVIQEVYGVRKKHINERGKVIKRKSE